MIELNKVYCMDCIEFMEQLPEGSVDLIYADPPFYGRKHFGENRDKQEYLEWSRKWVQESYRLLKKTGNVYLHCDTIFSHYLKVLLDEIFGEVNFHNEIVWYYNSGPRKKSDFGCRHDVIFRYSKADIYKFNADEVREAYSPDINIPASKARYYNPLGKVMDDVWRIPIIAQNDKQERLGYPTQKPEVLLERIIRASSDKGDLILDPFVGSGTAIVMAKRLGRNFLGCDISQEAIDIVNMRLKNEKN